MAALSGRRTSEIRHAHPCFSEEAHAKFGMLHLPVAPLCNIQCRHCTRRYDYGAASRMLKPAEAVERVSRMMDRSRNLTAVGIAGPGDPLANDATFETLSRIHREFPELILCVSTNGLALPERMEDLLHSGVRSITIKMDAITSLVAEKIYSLANFRGRVYHGREAAEMITHNQQRGLINAIDTGFMIRVNTIYMPGINDVEVPLIAWFAGIKGADVQNIVPLIPWARLAHLAKPTHEMIARMRAECAGHIEQTTHCGQCRTGACGMPAEDVDAEPQMLNETILEGYRQTVPRSHMIS